MAHDVPERQPKKFKLMLYAFPECADDRHLDCWGFYTNTNNIDYRLTQFCCTCECHIPGEND